MSIKKRLTFINELIEKNDLLKMVEQSHPINLSLKKTIDFNTFIHDFNSKIMYVKSGSTGHIFKGIINNDTHVAIKIVAFFKDNNYGLPSNILRPENAELKILQILSDFVINEITPHIILPITTFYSNIESFIGNNIKKNIIQSRKYNEFIDYYNRNKYYDYCSILISEWANNGDLLDFIRNHSTNLKLSHWRNIFFQIISTLAIIQNKYPSFRHNDLKANNILLHRTNSEKKEVKYIINNKEYIIPNIGLQIKIWDFDFACIPGIVDNDKVNAKWTNKINVTPVQNRYYDIHYFFNTLVKKGFFPELLTSSKIDKTVKNFFFRIIPPQLLKTNKFVSKRGRILSNKEIVTPLKLIENDPFFEIYRNFNIDNINNSKQDNINNSKQDNLNNSKQDNINNSKQNNLNNSKQNNLNNSKQDNINNSKQDNIN
jgi:hypothetical protein